MPSQKKIVITGAGGFIGLNLCKYFASNNYVIACISKEDFANQIPAAKKIVMRLPNPQFEKMIAAERPDFLLHCAGGASVAESFKEPEKDFENNVLITQFILETLKKHSAHTKVVFFSSAAVYGNPAKLPIQGDTPAEPISPYGYHKLICEFNLMNLLYSSVSFNFYNKKLKN